MFDESQKDLENCQNKMSDIQYMFTVYELI